MFYRVFLMKKTLPPIRSIIAFCLVLLGHALQAQTCSITLKPTISGCYQVGGQSKATVSVEVAWNNATVSPIANNTSDLITVTFAGQTRTINPGLFSTPEINTPAVEVEATQDVIVSPQVVSFEVDANATTQTIQAFFGATYTASTCKMEQTGVVLPAACPPTVCVAGQTGGTVWNDFNADGIKQSGETTGLLGVTVRAYDCAGNLVGTATTDVFGKYVFSPTIAASAYPIRVEFSNLPAFATQGAINGSDGRTTVQFVNVADCSVDLGVLDPTDYCQANPKLVIPCYVNGNPLLSGTSAPSDAVVSFDYNASGLKNASIMAHAAASEVGSVWGMAYNKFTKKVFSSATVKRHAGLGPLGLGGIYVTDFTTIPANGSTFNYSNFIDVSTIGINVGTIATNATRGLSATKANPSVDNDGYLKAAKVGIGGIDLSADGNKLYLTNLFDNKLYEIDITAYNADGTTKPTAANVKSFDMGAGINCVGGNLHIWAVKAYKGKVYTGMVCDASTSQNKSDLRAYVRELNGTAVSTIFDFPLTYPKGYVAASSPNIKGWFPWTDDWSSKIVPLSSPPNSARIIRPQPVLTALEFDIDGSMVIAFGDRTGLQSGYQNYNPNGNDGTFYEGNAGGDILRAFSNGTTFVLENNAKAGNANGYGPGNNQGPGFGEFYQDDFNQDKTLQHAENVVGGLALIPGSGEVLVTVMDPVNIPLGAVGRLYFNSGGVRHLNNGNGTLNTAFQIYGNSRDDIGTFGKSVGLGDAVLICNPPTYLEVGNRVWVDEDKDGIQDPCEKVLPGILVSLYQGTTRIASTTTTANGEYYFNNNPTSSTVAGTISNTAILPNTAYTVRFGTDGTTNQYNAGTGILTIGTASYSLTQANSTAPTASTLNDSNAQLTGGFASAAVTSGPNGSVNHTIDAGFICVPTLFASLSITPATCPVSGTVANNNGQIRLTGIQNADKVFLVTAGSALPSYTATGGVPVSNSAVSFTGLTNPASSSGQNYSVVLYNGPCCYTVVPALLPQTNCAVSCSIAATATPGVCNSATNQYTITGTINLTATTGGTAIITDGARSMTVAVAAAASSVAYSLTGLTSGTGSHTVIVSLAGCGSAVATYAAPASCSVAAVCSLSATATAGLCLTATNTYSLTVITTLTNPVTGTLTVNVPGASSPVTLPITATTTQATAVFNGLTSNGQAISATVNLPGCGSATPGFTAPASCSLAPICSLTVTPTAGVCNTATNTFSSTVAVRIANTNAGGVMIITDGTISQTLAVGANLNSFTSTATFNGLISDGSSRLVLASLAGCSSQTATYNAPASCSVAPCALSITTASLPNGQVGTAYSQAIAATGGTAPLSFTVSAGVLPAGLNLSAAGVITGTPTSATTASFTVSVSDGRNCSAVVPLTITTSALPVCSLTATATPGVCNSATNTYTLTGTVSATNGPGTQSLTVTANGASAVVTLTGNGPASYTLTSLTSDGLTKTVTVLSSATACGQTSVTYTAPASCTVAPLKASLGNYVWLDTNKNGVQDDGNTGVQSVTVVLCDATSGSAISTTLTDSNGGYLFSNLDPGSYRVKFTAPQGMTFTIPNSSSATPATDSNVNSLTGQKGSTPAVSLTAGESNLTIDAGLIPVAGTPTLAVVVGTPVCNSATNSYTTTGTVSLSNAPAGTLTITDNGATVAVVSVTAGQTSASFSVSGVSNTASHTVITTLANGVTVTANTTYNAPASCTVCSLSIITASLPNGQVGAAYSQTIAATGGTAPLTYSVTAGALPAGLNLNAAGVISGTPTSATTSSFTVKVTDSKNCSAVTPITITTAADPVCSLTATVTPGVCNSATNTYTLTGTVSATNGPGTQSLTITTNGASAVVTLTGNGPASYTLTGLPSDGLTKTVSVISSASACGQTSVTYTVPASCTAAPLKPSFVTTKQISKAKAKVGEVLTYTVTVANTGPITATGVIVSDTFSSGLSLVPGSVVTSLGSFSASAQGGTWTIPSLPVNTTATLVYSASVLAEGVLYNTARRQPLTPDDPGQEVKVCTSIPVQVCRNEPISVELSAPAGYNRYQWYRTTSAGTTLVSDITATSANAATAGVYTATVVGEYSVRVNEGVIGSCPDGSCCPVIIEEVEVPSYTALVRNPSCVGGAPQPNGQITLANLGAVPGQFVYQVSRGTSFSATQVVSGTATAVPINGVVGASLLPGSYTIRVWVLIDGQPSCARDLTVAVVENCICPTEICMPVVIRKTKSQGKPL